MNHLLRCHSIPHSILTMEVQQPGSQIRMTPIRFQCLRDRVLEYVCHFRPLVLRRRIEKCKAVSVGGDRVTELPLVSPLSYPFGHFVTCLCMKSYSCIAKIFTADSKNGINTVASY